MKTWSELYRTFARQSAMVSNAEANIVLEEFSHKILKTVKAEDYSKVSYSRVFCFFFTLCYFMWFFFYKNSSCMLNTQPGNGTVKQTKTEISVLCKLP